MLNIFNKPWFIYILLCDDGTLYTGITNNLQRRFSKHKAGKGARYTQRHGAKEILYYLEYPNHKQAAIREHQIKKLSRKGKLEMILDFNFLKDGRSSVKINTQRTLQS